MSKIIYLMLFLFSFNLLLNAAEPGSEWWGQNGTWSSDATTNALKCDATTNWGGANNWIATTFGTAGPWKDMTVKFDFYMPNSGNAIIWQFGQAGGDWANGGVKVQFNYYGIFAYNPSWAGGVTLLDANYGTSVHKYKLNGWNTAVINISAAGVVSVKLNGVNGASTFTPADINTLSGDFCSVNYQYSAGNDFQMRNVEVTKGAVSKKYFTSTPTAYTNMNMFSSTNAWFPVSIPEAVGPDNSTGGWYTVTTPGAEKIKYDGTITPTLTGIRTEKAALADEWWGTTIKFKAEVDAAGGTTTYKVGSNGVWNTRANGGRCIMLNINKYEVQILPEHEYGEAVQMWAWNSPTTYVPYSNSGPFDFEIIISDAATHTITVKINGVAAPITYNVAGVALNRLNANGPMYFEVYPGASPFVFSNVEMKKAGVAKTYFPTLNYVIAASANDGAKGSVTGAGTYQKSTDVTLTATATVGNRFTKWTEGATEVSTASTYTFTASAARTIVANFESTEVALNSNTNISDVANTPEADFVLNSGTLTVNASKTVKSLKANQGSKVLINSPLAITGDLTLVADKNTAPNVKVNSAVTVTGNLKLEKTFDNAKWYYVSFPTNVAVDNIVKVSGSGTMTLGTNWWIKSYNGGLRAQNGVGSNWENVLAGGTLTAKKGYVIGLASTLTGDYVLSFTLDKNLIALADAQRNVAVLANTGAAAVNNHGWNLIGQPFLSPYIGSSTSGTFNFYVTNGSGGYTAFDQANVPDINPFSSYFVQANAPLVSTGINFAIGGRQTVKSVSTTTQSTRIQLNVSNATGNDYALLKLDNDKTNDYEIGYDLEKWITTDATNPQIYTRLNNLDYAFNALPENSVSNLPLGIYTKTTGIHTISMTPNAATNISGLLLTDNVKGITTDLMKSDYSYDAASGTNNTRFTLGIQKVATGFVNPSQLGNAKLSVINGKIALTNLNEGAIVCVFDASGRLVAQKTEKGESISVDIKTKGIHCVQLTNGSRTQTVKVIL